MIDCKGSPLIAHDSLVGLKIQFEGIHVANAVRAGAGGVLNTEANSTLVPWVSMQSTIFTNCSSLGAGGGVLRISGGVLEVNSSKFNSNSAVQDGGSLLIVNETVSFITQSSFMHNFAGNSGGAIRVMENSNLTVDLVDMSFNVAGRDGGAIDLLEGSQLIATRVFITKCTAANSGGAIEIGASTAILSQSTVSFCHANFGGGLHTFWYRMDDGSDTEKNLLYLLDGVEISDCTAAKTCGGIFVAWGTLITSGAVNITRCGAYICGGLYVYDDGVAHLNDGVRIQDCWAGSNGGGMRLWVQNTNRLASLITTGNVIFEGAEHTHTYVL